MNIYLTVLSRYLCCVYFCSAMELSQCGEVYYETSCSVNNVINQSMFQLYIVFEPRHDKTNKSARLAEIQISLGIRLV